LKNALVDSFPSWQQTNSPKPFNVIIGLFKDTLIPGGRMSNIGQS
jgi:hypothetical protein